MSDREQNKKDEDEIFEKIEEANQREVELICENCDIQFKVLDTSDCPDCGYDNFEQMEDKIA